MYLYTDRITGEDLFTDAYPMKLIDDLYYEACPDMSRLSHHLIALQVEGQVISESNDIDESAIGGNSKSAGGAYALCVCVGCSCLD